MKTAGRPPVRQDRQFGQLALLVSISFWLTACATTEPDIRVDYDRSSDFTVFRSYGFAEELGTDRAGYSTLVTRYFRDAVDREMQQRGYRYSPDNPDLLVNFFANVRNVTTVRSRSTVWVAYGYYGYRYGMYHAWPLYADGVDTVHYKVGTANIDIVDAQRRQLIWEAVAEGRLTQQSMDNPRLAISAVVTDMFEQYPGRAYTQGPS